MSRVMTIKDKTGRMIYLSDERWKHILKHPEIINPLERIKDTLQYPDIITRTSQDNDVRFYYRYDKERKEYHFISVKYLNGEGFIITSLYTDKIQ